MPVAPERQREGSADMAIISPLLGGVVLMAAGIYQFTPLKQTCLTHC